MLQWQGHSVVVAGAERHAGAPHASLLIIDPGADPGELTRALGEGARGATHWRIRAAMGPSDPRLAERAQHQLLVLEPLPGRGDRATGRLSLAAQRVLAGGVMRHHR